MAKRKRRKAGKKRSNQRMPGWLYLLFGLSIGLAVAAGVYINDRRETPIGAFLTPEKDFSQPRSKKEPKPQKAESSDDDSIDFDFYDMLPSLDVQIYEDDTAAPKPRQKPAPVVKAGIYILQAGSFTKLEDAQRREGEIALLGIRAEVRKGDANNRTVYRVYTRPLETPEEVNRIRNRLNENGIETLAKRVSD
jgi:cell division protein FtsN